MQEAGAHAVPLDDGAGSRGYRLLFYGVLVLAAALRFIAIGKFSLGNDEIQEIFWARLAWPVMLSGVAYDAVHPPLDYVVQWMLVRVTSVEWVHRLPSVLAGIGTVALTGTLAGRWFGPGASAGAALLLAISPMHIRYSQEVRPYAIGLFLLVAAVVTLETYRTSRRRRHIFLWAVFVWLSAAWLYLAGLIAVIVSLSMLVTRWREYRTVWRALPPIVAAGALLYSPWIAVVMRAARGTAPVAAQTLDWPWWSYRLQTLATGDWAVEPVSPGSWLFWGLAAAGAAVSLSRRVYAAVMWPAGGFAALIALLQVQPHFPAVRYLLPAWIGCFPLVGAAVDWLAGKSRAAIAVVLIVIGGYSGVTLGAYYSHGRPEWDRAVNYVRRHMQPQDRVFAVNQWSERNFGHYWREATATEVARLPESGRIQGPAWIVVAACPMSADARERLDRLELRRSLPWTNRCELRYVPAGATFEAGGHLCD